MNTWHIQLESQRMDRKAHLRLFGLVLFSVAIHLTLIISGPLRWEQKGEGSPALQIHMRAINDEVKTTPNSAPPVQKMEHKAQNAIKPVAVDKTPSLTAVTRAQERSPTPGVTTVKKITPKEKVVTESEPLTQQVAAIPAPTSPETTAQVEPPINDKPAAVAKNGSNTLERKEISRQLQQELARHFNYPFLARRRGWQGEVTLAFTLESDGRIMNIRIANSSGHSILDRAALASLNKVERIEHGLLQELSFELPVIYRLQKG